MASSNKNDSKAATLARIQRTEVYAEGVRRAFAKTVNAILALNKTMPKLDEGEMYSFDAQKESMQKKVETLLRQLHSVVTTAIKRGIVLEWDKANDECDKLVQSCFGKEVLSSSTFTAWTNRNETAQQSFINRAEKGLNLSQRIWQNVQQLRDEMEVAMTVAIGEGNSAASMSRKVRQYLNDPDLMFRRFRYKDENGEWQRKWKKRVKDKATGKYKWIDYDKDSYKVGAGVYKSSAKNAMRVTRTETNIAYRRADHERWSQMDFVLGQRVNLSRSHPKKDICDKLAGDYPKDFVFDGWHPQCFCYVTPITLPPEETAHLTKMMLNGEDWRAELKRLVRGREIKSYPDNFKEWVNDNADKIAASKARGTEPYFIKNNAKVIDKILNPDQTPSIEDIAAKRHEERTPEREKELRDYWAKKVAEGDERRKKQAILDKAAERHAARTPEHIAEIQQRAAERQKKHALIKKTANNVLKVANDYAEVDFADLEKYINDGNLDAMQKQTKIVAQQIAGVKADEKFLSDLIPDVHTWHKQFSSEELHKVYDAVEAKLSQFALMSLEQQKKKLDFEVQYVADPSKYKAGAVKHSTWKVAQDAYQKELQSVIYKIDVNTAINDLQAVKTWSKAHPKSLKVANFLADAENAINAKEDIASIKSKVSLAIQEYQKRLAEQAKRDAKKLAKGIKETTFASLDVKVRDKLVNDFESGKQSVQQRYDKLFKDASSDWASLNDEEKILLTKYTQSYCYLNEPLRNMNYTGGRPQSEYNNDMPKITAALNKCKARENMIVRRGTGDYYIPELGKYLSSVDVGDVFVDGAFLSTACHKSKGFSQSYNMVIVVPKGACGIFAEPFSHFNSDMRYDYEGSIWDGSYKCGIGGEFEWIGQRGNKFRVLSKNGKTIYLEIIGQLYVQPK